MANNMKAHNRDLFARILSRLPHEFQSSADVQLARYVETSSSEKSRLKGAKILAIETPLPGVHTACLTDGMAYYVCWSVDGLLPGQPIKGMVGDRTTCAGLSTFLWSQNIWPLRDIDPDRKSVV